MYSKYWVYIQLRVKVGCRPLMRSLHRSPPSLVRIDESFGYVLSGSYPCVVTDSRCRGLTQSTWFTGIAQYLSYVERRCSSCISSSSKVFGTGIKVPCREQHSQGPSQVFPGHSSLGHFFSISCKAWCIASFASSAPCVFFPNFTLEFFQFVILQIVWCSWRSKHWSKQDK